MEKLPHHYNVSASAASEGTMALESAALTPMECASPREFGGPGNLWSPETMMTGALAGCFILTFRAVARASSFPWLKLTCAAEGLLDRTDGMLRFTQFTLRPTLTVPAGSDCGRALQLLEKAERGCLISNSLRAAVRLEPAVIEAEAAPLAEAR